MLWCVDRLDSYGKTAALRGAVERYAMTLDVAYLQPSMRAFNYSYDWLKGQGFFTANDCVGLDHAAYRYNRLRLILKLICQLFA
jgi:hypothetical protein